jgi:hypothetical protein
MPLCCVDSVKSRIENAVAKRQLNFCGKDPYSEGSPQSIRLWFPGLRGLRQEIAAGAWFRLPLQLLLFLCGACAAKLSNIQRRFSSCEPVATRYIGPNWSYTYIRQFWSDYKIVMKN